MSKVSRDEQVLPKVYNCFERPVDPGISNFSEDRTRQAHRDECDVNNIVKRLEQTGFLPEGRGPGAFGDFTGLEFQDMLTRVNAAQAAFDSLPAAIRTRFGNDPGELLDFMDDPSNREEAVKLGLVRRRESDDVKSRSRRGVDREEVKGGVATPGSGTATGGSGAK